MCYLSSKGIVACTAYGDVREYDMKAARKPVIIGKLTNDGMMLSHITKSKVNENIIFAVS